MRSMTRSRGRMLPTLYCILFATCNPVSLGPIFVYGILLHRFRLILIYSQDHFSRWFVLFNQDFFGIGFRLHQFFCYIMSRWVEWSLDRTTYSSGRLNKFGTLWARFSFRKQVNKVLNTQFQAQATQQPHLPSLIYRSRTVSDLLLVFYCLDSDQPTIKPKEFRSI